MTSPARRTTTVSPGRTSLRATSSSLCSVAIPTFAPPTNTGSSTANGVARPVRPMLTMMSRSSVVFSSGGNLYAIAQRGARRDTHLRALPEVVDLHDDAVDVVAERVPVRFHPLAEPEHAFEIVERLDVRVHREAERREPRERLLVRPQPRATFFRAELIRVQREVAGRGDARVLLAQAAGGRVAGVGEQALSRLALAPVQRLERRERHEHLAPHLEQRGDVLRLSLQLLRHRFDRAQVLGDVLAGHAVAARRADREPPVVVLQRDREPVELGLGDEADRLGDQALDARAPGEQLVARERVVERQHRHAVHDRRERRRGPPAGTLRRRVGGDERRMLRFELA